MEKVTVPQWVQDYNKTQPTQENTVEVLKLKSELASLRQQLKEREEALKELLPIVEWFTTEYPMDAENLSAKAIIERARNLLSK